MQRKYREATLVFVCLILPMNIVQFVRIAILLFSLDSFHRTLTGENRSRFCLHYARYIGICDMIV